MNKIILILAILLIIFGGLGFYLQIVNGNTNYLRSERFNVFYSEQMPPRGIFLDRNNEVLAANREVYNLMVYTDTLSNEFTLDLLQYLKESESEFENEIEENLELLTKTDIRLVRPILEGVNVNKLNTITAISEYFPNIFIEKKFERVYLYSEEFSHVLGYLGYGEANGYEKQNNEWEGVYRLEQKLNKYLEGQSGRVIERGGSKINYPGIPGDSVQLTIDAHWQSEIYRLLGEYVDRLNAAGGAGVMLDIQSGEIISLVSYPGFDTELFSNGKVSNSYLNFLNNSRLTPLQDKVISSAYVPGSIFKLFSSYVLLKEQIVSDVDTYNSAGCIVLGDSEICEFNRNSYGTVDLESALAYSSNTFFCNYFLEYFSADKSLKLANLYNNLGLGSATDIDLSFEVPGNIENPSNKLQTNEWYPGDTCNLAIGQGTTLLTPLQAANMVAILERRGTKIAPHLLDKISSPDSRVKKRFETTINADVTLKDHEVTPILKGMEMAAYGSESVLQGFFKDHKDNKLRVKTGSAETSENLDGVVYDRVHSWVIGSFEINNRRYAFSFFLQYGGGGYELAPIVSDFIDFVNM